MNSQQYKLIFPEFEGRTDEERKDWTSFILNMTKHTEAGKFNDKYGVMVFKANYGYISVMKSIVDHYTNQLKNEDSNVVVMEEVDDYKAKTWIVGNADKIKQMVDDELKGV
jgi:hypothetical protein